MAEKQRFIDSLKEEVQECRDTLIEKNILYDIILIDKYFTERMKEYEKR